MDCTIATIKEKENKNEKDSLSEAWDSVLVRQVEKKERRFIQPFAGLTRQPVTPNSLSESRSKFVLFFPHSY